MVKFDGQAVSGIVEPGESVQLTISGRTTGVAFEGSDQIRVIAPGEK